MAAGDITHVAVDGTALTNSLATKYTVPASKVALCVEIVLCNDDTAERIVEIQFIESGQSAAVGRKVVAQQAGTPFAMTAGETRAYSFNCMLEAGDFIQAKADTGSVVAMRMGITLKEV